MTHRHNEDERELVRRLRRGDPAALAAFADAFLDRIYAFVYYRVAGDRQSAEDITQETFAAALGALERYDGRAGFYTWLAGIARHKVADHYRRLRRLQQAQAALERAADLTSAEDLGAGLEREERRRLVLTAMRDLPPHYQQVLTLKYLDRLSGRQLAAELDLSEEAAASLLARARAAFRRAFRIRMAGTTEDDIREQA